MDFAYQLLHTAPKRVKKACRNVMKWTDIMPVTKERRNREVTWFDHIIVLSEVCIKCYVQTVSCCLWTKLEVFRFSAIFGHKSHGIFLLYPLFKEVPSNSCIWSSCSITSVVDLHMVHLHSIAIKWACHQMKLSVKSVLLSWKQNFSFFNFLDSGLLPKQS